MVRSAERPLRHESAACAQIACHRMYLGGLQSLLRGHGRQDGRHAPRQHRLARSGRAYHYHVMAACRRDLQCTFGERLPLHVGEVLGIRIPVVRDRHAARLGLDDPFAVERLGHPGERRHRQCLYALHHRGLGGILARHIYAAQTFRARLGRHGQHSAYAPHAAVERQLAHESRVGELVGRHLLRRRQNRHRYGQIESRPLLAQVGGSQIHHALARRHAKARVLERRTYALLALAHGVVGQSDQKEAQTAARDAHLHRDLHGPDARHCARMRANYHRL